MQIQYFERLNPEMECIYLLERRYQAGEDAPHSIPALRDYLSGKYNIPMFELEAMLQPLIDLENYVVSNLQVSEEQLRDILKKLSDGDEYGIILRAKGIIPCTDGTWLHFDMVPEEYEIRRGDADYTGRLCVIGSHLDEEELAKLFGLA